MNREQRRAAERAAKQTPRGRRQRHYAAANLPRPDEVHRAFHPLDSLLEQILATGELETAEGIAIMRGHDAGEWYTAPDAIDGWIEFWERATRRLSLPTVDLAPLRQLVEAFRDDLPLTRSAIEDCIDCQTKLRAIYRRCNVYQIRDVAHEEQIAIQLEAIHGG